MSSYSQAFNALHKMAGSPMLRCIRPRSSWTIPAGYSWDANADRYVDSGGAVLEPTTGNLPYDDVAILPSQGSELFDLTAGGIVDSGYKMARILAASKATVEAAEFTLLDGLEYLVRESTPNVAGNPTGYTVRLAKR